MKKYYSLAKNILFPICRSLTGSGVKKTLTIIKKEFPKLKIEKIKSGSKVFDWKVPPEWNIKNAHVLDSHGNKIIDFKNNNLHLVSYSIPVNKRLKKKQFVKKNLFFKKTTKCNSLYYILLQKKMGFLC